MGRIYAPYAAKDLERNGKKKRETRKRRKKNFNYRIFIYNYPPIFIYLATISLLGLKLSTGKDGSQNQKQSK